MDRRHTMLPPPFSHNQPTDPPLAPHHCIACQVYYAQANSVFCPTCKEDSDKVRLKLTHWIQRYERTFNVGFRLLFPGDAEFFGGEPVVYPDTGLNTIPTETEVLRGTIPVYDDDEVLIDITSEDIIETSIDPDDMSLNYKSSTTDTEEYCRGLIDELEKTRKECDK